jgi:hypothetical protein
MYTNAMGYRCAIMIPSTTVGLSAGSVNSTRFPRTFGVWVLLLTEEVVAVEVAEEAVLVVVVLVLSVDDSSLILMDATAP